MDRQNDKKRKQILKKIRESGKLTDNTDIQIGEKKDIQTNEKHTESREEKLISDNEMILAKKDLYRKQRTILNLIQFHTSDHHHEEVHSSHHPDTHVDAPSLLHGGGLKDKDGNLHLHLHGEC